MSIEMHKANGRSFGHRPGATNEVVASSEMVSLSLRDSDIVLSATCLFLEGGELFADTAGEWDDRFAFVAPECLVEGGDSFVLTDRASQDLRPASYVRRVGVGRWGHDLRTRPLHGTGIPMIERTYGHLVADSDDRVRAKLEDRAERVLAARVDAVWPSEPGVGAVSAAENLPTQSGSERERRDSNPRPPA